MTRLRVSNWPLRVKLFAVNGAVLGLAIVGLFSGFRLSTQIKDTASELEERASRNVALVAELQDRLAKLILQKEFLLGSEDSIATSENFRKEFGDLLFEYQQFKGTWARLLVSEAVPLDEEIDSVTPYQEAVTGLARDYGFPVQYYTQQFDEFLLDDRT